MENCVHRVDTIVVNKGSEAGDHFAQDNAEREDVTTTIHSLSQQLFRGHVIDSTHQRAGFRFDSKKSLLCTVRGECAFTLRDEFSETEIKNLGVAIAADHQVFWFEVAMNYSDVVSFTK